MRLLGLSGFGTQVFSSYVKPYTDEMALFREPRDKCHRPPSEPQQCIRSCLCSYGLHQNHPSKLIRHPETPVVLASMGAVQGGERHARYYRASRTMCHHGDPTLAPRDGLRRQRPRPKKISCSAVVGISHGKSDHNTNIGPTTTVIWIPARPAGQFIPFFISAHRSTPRATQVYRRLWIHKQWRSRTGTYLLPSPRFSRGCPRADL